MAQKKVGNTIYDGVDWFFGKLADGLDWLMGPGFWWVTFPVILIGVAVVGLIVYGIPAIVGTLDEMDFSWVGPLLDKLFAPKNKKPKKEPEPTTPTQPAEPITTQPSQPTTTRPPTTTQPPANDQVEKIEVSPNSVDGFTTRCIYVGKGESKDVKVTISPSKANQNYTWSFAPTGIASANKSSPTITAIKEGVTTATATASGNTAKKDSVKVIAITKLSPIKGWMTGTQYLYDGPNDTSPVRLSTEAAMNTEIKILGICDKSYFIDVNGNKGFVLMSNVFAYEKRGLENNLSAFDKTAGVKVVTKSDKAYYDYTVPVDRRLLEQVPIFWSNYLKIPWFISQVDTGRPWDIKDNSTIPWQTQFGQLRFPGYRGTRPNGHNEQFVYRDRIESKDSLGNITYGYLGTASGYPVSFLIGGSIYAALPDMDDPNDWPEITRGIFYFRADNPTWPV